MLKNVLEPVMSRLIRVMEIFMTLMLVVMMSSLMWQVITRFVVKVPAIWTEEIARYSFIYMTMIGAALGVRYSQHFGMTLVTDMFNEKFRLMYERYVVNGVIFVSSLFLMYYGWDFTFTLGMVRVSPTFLTPMALVFISIPISSLLMAVFSVYNMAFGNYAEPAIEVEEVNELEKLL